MTDQVDQAIAAAGAPDAVEMMPIQVTIGSTGRPFQIAVPADMTEGELIEVVSWMTRELAGELMRRRNMAAGRIILPFGRPT